jgi:hypothetical protein
MNATEKQISYCGLICSSCPIFVSTQTGDAEKKKEISALLKSEYNVMLEPEEILCDGCLSITGRHLEGYEKCEIRKCGQEKNIENCGQCEEYICEKLAGFSEFSDACRETLDEVKRGLS